MYEKELEQAGLKVGKYQSFNSEIQNEKTGYQKQMDSFNQYNAQFNNSNNEAINRSLLNGTHSPATEPFRINRNALAEMEFVPAETSEEFKQANDYSSQWLNNLNIATEDEIEQWRAKGKMGLGETISKLTAAGAVAHFLPYVGSTYEVAQDVKLMNVMNKMHKGEKVSDEEQEQLIEYLRNLKELQVRGSTMGSHVFNALYESIPFAVEFGLGLWGGGSGTAYSLSQKGARLAARKAFKEVLRKELAEGTEKSVLSAARNVYKDVYKNTYSQALKGGAARGIKELGAKESLKVIGKQFPKDALRATVGSPQMAYSTIKNAVGNYADRQLSTGFEITDAGLAVFKEPENKATSIMRALGSSVLDNVTETMGWTFLPLKSYFSKPMQKMLPEKFFTEFDKLVSSHFGMKATDALRKYGYDGVIEEMGEELINRFLCQVFNINGDYTFDGFMNNVFYADNPSQWGVEALSFALMSGAGHGIVGLNNIIKEKQRENANNKDIEALLDLYNSNHYSLAEYYLDQGLIKLNGSKSIAEEKLMQRLKKNGIPEEVAQDYADTLSEIGKREALSNYPDTTETLTEAIVEQLEKTGYQGKIDKEKAAEIMASITTPIAEALNYTPEEVAQELPHITQSENYSYFDDDGNVIEKEDIEKKYKEYSDIFESLPENTPDNVLNDVMTALNILNDMKNGILTEEDAAKAALIFDNEKYFQQAQEDRHYKEMSDYYEDLYGDEVYNQSAQFAGADKNEAADAAKEYAEKGTDSKYFKKWTDNATFIDSKTAQNYNFKTGENVAIEVYHGTRSIFEIFDKSKKGKSSDTARVGFWFSDKENFGKNFAQNIWYGDEEKPISMHCYISMKNPKVYEEKIVSDEEKEQAKNRVKEIENKIKELNQEFNRIVQTTGSFAKATETVEKPRELLKEELKQAKSEYAELRYTDAYEQLRTDIRKIEGGNAEDANFGGLGMVLKNQDTVEKFVESLKEQGYDGIIIKGTHFDSEDAETDKNNQYAVFEPEQIKSVDNRGTFDAKNPNIYFQFIGKKGAENYKPEILKDLEKAKELDKNGTTKYGIYNQTGWFKGNDNEWRYEISDKDAEIIPDKIKYVEPDKKYSIENFTKEIDSYNNDLNKYVQEKDNGELTQEEFDELYSVTMEQKLEYIKEYDEHAEKIKSNHVRLGDILKHDALYKAYPELKKLFVEFIPNDVNFGGRLTGSGMFQTIEIPERTLKSDRLKSVLLHEVQHYIQDREEFAQGGNPENVEEIIRYVLNDINNSKEERERKELVKELDDLYKDNFVIGSALQILKLKDRPESMFKSWWWNKYGSWYVPRKTRKKEYKSFMSEWTDKFLQGVHKQMEEKGEVDRYHEYLEKDIEELRKEYRNIQAKIKRLWKKIPRDIARNFRQAILDLEKTHTRYEEEELRKELYMRLAGEVEARNTQARMNMTEEERKETFPSTTQDYDDEQQLIYFSDGSTVSYSPIEINNSGQNERYFAFEKYDIDSEQKAIYKKYSELVEKILQKENKYSGNITLGNTPEVLLECGLDNLPLETTVENILKMKNKARHNVYPKTLKNLPYLLNNPLAVFKSNNSDNKVIVLINTKGKTDAPVVITIDKNNTKGVNEVNFITSGYEKSLSSIKDLLSNNLIKIKKNIPSWLQELKNSIHDSVSENHKSVNAEPKRDNNIITDNKENINPNIAEKFIDRYYQSDSVNNNSDDIFENLEKEHEELEYEINTQTSMFDNVNDARKIHLSKGSFLPIPKFIELYKNADESTFVHELAHWWLDTLVANENKSERIAEDLATIRKWLKNDGGKFTHDEHEKFARGFEVYLRNGSAKNNKLKKIFEDFKNWLLKIYDDIRQLGYTPEELGEVENVFNKILTTERERIQAAVFDRVNSVQEEIDTIRANQEIEFSELEKIEKNNIESNLRYQQSQTKIKEYLNKAAKQAARVPAAVQEVRKRYKDVTFSILETATGMKRQQIANPRNWEKVEKLIEGNDRISGGDGFLREWAEFYTDTGVSYDNQEIGADDELAMRAFEVMKSGNYNFAEVGFDELDDEEIGQFFGMFDYLSDRVMKLKGSEKDYAMEALTELCNKIPSVPNEVMNEIVEKLQQISDTYVEQKVNERSNSSMRNVSLETQFRAYIIDKIHNMKYYDTEEKRYARMSSVDKLYNMISAATNLYNAKEIVRRINNRAIEELENKQKTILAKEIQKQVKIGSKTVKSGQVQKGKFDWRTNTVFAKLRDLNKLSIEEARKEFETYTMLEDIEKGESREDINEDNVKTLNHPKTEEDRLFCSFLEYKSSKIKEMNVQATRNLLEKILELKDIGRRVKSEAEFKKAFEREDLKQGLADIITEKLKNRNFAKHIAKFVGSGGVTLANWETILTVLFDRNTARKYSLLELESKAEIYAHKKMVEMFNVIREVYNIKQRANDNIVHKIQNTYDRMVDFDAAQDIIKIFNEYDKQTITVREQTWNKDTLEVLETNQELTHAQVMMLYGWSLNGNLKERLLNTYGEIQLDWMFSTLSEQDKELMKRLSQFCDTMYDDTNEVFINTTGLSLPKVENYLPSKTERCGSDLDLYGERVVRASNFSATKLRKNCSRIKMNPLNPLQVLVPHINKTARYVILSERLNYLNRLFCDNPLIEKALQDAFSDGVVTFNSASGYDYVHNTKTGEKVKLEINNNIQVSSIKAKDINTTKIPFEISDKPSENKKRLINELNLNENSYDVKNYATDESIVIDKKTIEKSITNVKKNNTDYETFLKILLNMKDLFATSQKILSHKDIKSDSDLIIDRYANIVKIEGKDYLLEFVVKNREEAYLYSINALNNKEATSPNASKVNDLSAPDVANNSIRYIQDVFKSKLVQQYNKDWKQKEIASKNAQSKKKNIIEKFFGRKKENVGSKLARIMRNQLAASTYENYARTYSVTSDIMNTIGNNFVTAAIGGNLKVTLTQLISVINYSEDMPVASWAKGFGECLTKPKETIKFMMDNCEYLSARLAGNSQNEVMVNLVNESGKLRNLRKFWVSNTKFGDILAIIFGGKPYVDYLMNVKGYSKEDAFKKFVENTLRSQQSGHASATSAWQKDQSRNGVAKIVLGAFNNTNLQYERKWVEALSNASKGDISKGELAKAFLIYKVFNPIMFTSLFTNLALSALINGLVQGNDEPDKIWESFGLDLGLAVLLSNIKAYGWAGIVASTILSIGIGSLTEHEIYVSNKLPILSDIEDAARKIFGKGLKGELETADWLAITASVANLSGHPVERISKEFKGAYDFAQGDYQKGIYEMIGYGDYRATIGATGKPPERRK